MEILAPRCLVPLMIIIHLCCFRYEQLGEMGSPDRVEQYRRTLRQALHVWLDQFPEDYKEPPNFPVNLKCICLVTRILTFTFFFSVCPIWRISVGK